MQVQHPFLKQHSQKVQSILHLYADEGFCFRGIWSLTPESGGLLQGRSHDVRDRFLQALSVRSEEVRKMHRADLMFYHK